MAENTQKTKVGTHFACQKSEKICVIQKFFVPLQRKGVRMMREPNEKRKL